MDDEQRVRSYLLALEQDTATPDELAELEQGFVLVGRQWAKRESIPAQAFALLGVPAHVLRSAGFVVP